MIGRRCQFEVNGPEIVGTIYVTQRGADEAEIIRRATERAAMRSGDPAPVFVRFG